MRRRIIKQGKATLTVSLPAKWTKKLGLGQGDEVDIHEEQNDLLISSGKHEELRRETLDLTELDTLLKRIVAATYLKGADEIEVRVDSVEKARVIQGRVREMIGMEVVQQGRDMLLIKDIAGTTDMAFDPLLRRVFFMINTVAEESTNALRRKETDLAYLADMETNINRFTDHCFRLLNKHGYKVFSQTPVIYTIVLLLEQLADDYKALTSFVTKNKMTVDDDALETLARVHRQFRAFEALFYAFSHDKAAALAQEHDAIMLAIDKRLSSTKSAKDAQVLHMLKSMEHDIIRMMGQALTLA
ncbi:MAG: AbrB/MazE/SpoVT family DNA-binding domain-containing protein [Nanoarchaeota archaeon]